MLGGEQGSQAQVPNGPLIRTSGRPGESPVAIGHRLTRKCAACKGKGSFALLITAEPCEPCRGQGWIPVSVGEAVERGEEYRLDGKPFTVESTGVGVGIDVEFGGEDAAGVPYIRPVEPRYIDLYRGRKYGIVEHVSPLMRGDPESRAVTATENAIMQENVAAILADIRKVWQNQVDHLLGVLWP